MKSAGDALRRATPSSTEPRASSGTTIHVVLTCTKGKTRPPLPSLSLGAVQGRTPEARAEAWIGRLQRHLPGSVTARELYSGDHWKVGRSIPATAAAAGFDVRLWVASAGYGLIPVEAGLAPYSATFSVRHPDFVGLGMAGVRRGDAVGRWWMAVAAWKGPAPREPRSIRALAEADPAASVLVVASAPYLEAMRSDLAASADVLADWRQLAVVSAGGRDVEGLQRHALPFDGRLRQVVRGGDISLNVRVARELLQRGVAPRVDELSRAVQELGRGLQRPSAPVRSAQGDDNVRSFIREELRANPSARWSPLLRRFRSELGRACEQKRFRDLFHEVAGEAAPEPAGEHGSGGPGTMDAYLDAYP